MVNKKESTKKESKESAESKQSSDRFQLSEFTKDTREELSKVVWPSRQQLISESAAVILMVSLAAAVIYLVDNFFAWFASQPFMFG